MDTQYIVGVDAGGSRTRLRFATPDGRTIRTVTYPAGEWTNLDASGMAYLIGRHVRQVTDTSPAALGVGAHGCDSDNECQELQQALRAEFGVPVAVVNDAFLLEEALAVREPCVGLVVGTGSIAVARDTAGRSLYAGGWGWLIGDPASGWGTVREAVRALSEAHDRGEHDSDPLLNALLNRSGARSLRELVSMMQGQPARDWARWAPTVFDAAAAGSPAALVAVEGGADALVELTADLMARGARAERAVAGGSVIVGQRGLAERVAEHLGRRFGLALTVFTGEPVEGAVRLARRLCSGS